MVFHGLVRLDETLPTMPWQEMGYRLLSCYKRNSVAVHQLHLIPSPAYSFHRKCNQRVLFVRLKVKDLRHPEIPMKSGELHSNSVNSTYSFHRKCNRTESFQNAFRSEARVTELERGQRRSIPGRQSKDRDLGRGGWEGYDVKGDNTRRKCNGRFSGTRFIFGLHKEELVLGKRLLVFTGEDS
ncbi:hypothetical protein CDAR_259391 [Caerostris darwini]|uniref:Uncharacterized protein n=1 Tax=Caerostris darwini TaxID=1538125 RepID=A0AAV4VN51_9ARAC|nr:hypothetical protein CDAR_259391 [Caerostris darwini]